MYSQQKIRLGKGLEPLFSAVSCGDDILRGARRFDGIGDALGFDVALSLESVNLLWKFPKIKNGS